MKKLLLSIVTFCFHAPLGCMNALSAKPALFLANAAGSETTNQDSKSYKTDAAIATRHLLFKAGSDASHIVVCTAAGIPLGTVPDEADAAEVDVEVCLLGIHGSTRNMVASEAIAANVALYTAASGKVQDLPVAAGTYYFVGYSLNAAAADGDIIEVQHCTPIKTVIP